MVYLGPLGPGDAETGKTNPYDHPDLTDDDRAWIRAQLAAVGLALPERNPSDWVTMERIR